MFIFLPADHPPPCGLCPRQGVYLGLGQEGEDHIIYLISHSDYMVSNPIHSAHLSVPNVRYKDILVTIIYMAYHDTT